MNESNPRHDHLLRKAGEAKRGGHDAWAVQSTGEKVAVALVLNRPDWLAEQGYTIAEAIWQHTPLRSAASLSSLSVHLR